MSQTQYLVLDLDHTILHMLKTSEMPPNDFGLAEDVVQFTHNDVEYSVALRVGTTSLVRAVKSIGVKVVVVTCNLVAEKVMAALSARCDVFEGVPLHVIESREKGAKSTIAVGLAGASRVVIVDDSISAWTQSDQNAVLEAQRYDIVELTALANDDDDEDAEDQVDAQLGYLTQTKDELLSIFSSPKIDWTSSSPPERSSAVAGTPLLQQPPPNTTNQPIHNQSSMLFYKNNQPAPMGQQQQHQQQQHMLQGGSKKRPLEEEVAAGAFAGSARPNQYERATAAAPSPSSAGNNKPYEEGSGGHSFGPPPPKKYHSSIPLVSTRT